MPPTTNTSSRSLRVQTVGIGKVWAQCLGHMDTHLRAATARPARSSARSPGAPDGDHTAPPGAPGLLEAVLDQLLAGADTHILLLPKGLLNELKTAPSGRVLDARTSPLAGRRTGSFQSRHAAATPA